MNRRHEALLDTEPVVQHLGQRRQAVRRAGGVGDHRVLRRVVGGVVDAETHREIRVSRGSRDDHPLGATLEVPRRCVARREHAGRLDDHLDAVVAPGDLGRVALFQLLDLLAVDRESAVADLDLVAQRPPDRVVLQQEGHRLAVAERVVDGDQLHAGGFAPVQQGPVEGAADPPVSVDPYSYGHQMCLRALDSVAVLSRRRRTTAEPAALPPVCPDRAPARRPGPLRPERARRPSP